MKKNNDKTEILLAGTFPPPYGGVAVFNTMLCSNFNNRDIPYQCYYVSASNKNHDKMCLPLDPLEYVRTLFSTSDRGKILLDSANMFLEYPIGRAALYRGSAWCIYKVLRRHKWVKILHDGSLPGRYDKFTKRQQKLFRSLIKWTDSVIVVSSELEKWLRCKIGYKKQITTIGSLLPMYIDEDVSIPQDIADFIAKYDKIVLTVGTCEEAYGFDQVIEALRLVRPRFSEDSIGLIIVDGGFACMDESYIVKQKALAEEDNTLFVPNGIPHDEMIKIMEKSDVYIRGFFFESYGISRIEALMCGTPVIATNVGKTEGMVTYEFGDIKDLSNKLAKILNDELPGDLHDWIVYYREEAERNYNAVVDVLRKARWRK